MASADPSSQGETAERRFLTFRMDRRLYALPAEEVAEVIRMPIVARVPQSPVGLLGLANLRGSVLPIVSLRALLGQAGEADGALARAIVLDGASPVALAVDRIEAFVSVEPGRIETRRAELASEPGERLSGAFQSGEDVAKILDFAALAASAFVRRAPTQRPAATRVATAAQAEDAAAPAVKLITFDVAGQVFAFDLDQVREVTPLPPTLARTPGADSAILGVADYRDGLLPLLSLRALLGLPLAASSERDSVVVTQVGGVLVGLVADRMGAVLSADPSLIEPIPSVLAARTGGEAKISAIYRHDDGRRLVSILDPEQLFREDVMQRLGRTDATAPTLAGDGEAGASLSQFLVFQLGDDEFALPIDAVDEVTAAPTQIVKLPKTPKFLEGVINLRGEVLPVVDQRQRFDMPRLEDGSRRRLLVVRTERHRAGLIVDSVSEVLSFDAAAIQPAPELTGQATKLVEGVINLEAAGRIVLVLGPSELLSRAERGLLDAFDKGAAKAKP
jgi:purine-binding chemotaxis protein CheW